MNMFARFNENPAMTLQDIKETKRYGRTDGRTDGQRENSIPPTNKVCGGIKSVKNFRTNTVPLSFPRDLAVHLPFCSSRQHLKHALLSVLAPWDVLMVIIQSHGLLQCLGQKISETNTGI